MPIILARIAVALTALLVAAPPAPAAKPRAPERVQGSYIVVYERSVDRPVEETEGLERAQGFKSRLRYRWALKGFSARLTAKQVRELRSDPDVAFVTPDRRVEAVGTVALAPGEGVPTGVKRIQAASSIGAHEASSVNVAVIDTGIDLVHPDLNARDGRNCVGSGPAQDDKGHGTHVAGIIGARNNGAGVVGVAPGTRLFSVKVLDAGGIGTWSQIICGVDWVTATRSDDDPSNDIGVANMSLSGLGQPVEACPTTTDPAHLAICASVAAGVTYVVAAGNDGWDYDYTSAPNLPAAYPEVLTATAMSDADGRPGGSGGAPGCATSQADDRYASFSNYAATAAGAAHTIAAPGVCVRSTLRGGRYGNMSGTSMAAPHVAGAAALCLGEAGAARPCAGLTPAQIVAKLRADAEEYTNAVPFFGFSGDPLRLVQGAYFGYLPWAGWDSVAPVVGSFSPADGAAAVPASSTVAVLFSEPMDKPTAQAAFSLRRTSDGAPVAGRFTWSGNKMTFRPSNALAENTGYTASVGTGALDAAGNQLAGATASSFRTGTLVTAYPSTATVETGSLRAGGPSALTLDDDVHYEVNSTTSATRTASWIATTGGVSNGLTTLRVAYSGKGSIDRKQTISLWNWTKGSWTQLDSRTVGSTEVLVDKAAAGALGEHVRGTSGDGDLRVRLRCTNGTASFYVSADLLRVTYTR